MASGKDKTKAKTKTGSAASKALNAVRQADIRVKELFAFNLLPPKSHAQLRREALRAARNFYAAAMPIGLAILALFLFLLNEVILASNLRNWENARNNLNSELRNPNSFLGQLKVRNGELRTKTEFIAEPVQKNVDFNDVFTVTNNAFRNNKTNSQPTSYGREESGEFVVNGISRNANGPAEILENFQKQPEVKLAALKQVRKDTTTNEYLFTIAFVSNTIQEEEV